MQFGTSPASYRHRVCCLWYGQPGTLASLSAIPASFARGSGVAVRFQSSEASTVGLCSSLAPCLYIYFLKHASSRIFCNSLMFSATTFSRSTRC